MRIPRQIVMLAAMVGLLAACNHTPTWLGGAPEAVVRAKGKRENVIARTAQVKADAAVAELPIELPDQMPLENWLSRNAAMLTPHIGLTGIAHEQSETVGEGNAFSRSEVPAPMVVQAHVLAMDAAGAISAHDATDISRVLWVNNDAVPDDVDDVLGGGFAAAEGVVFATTGYGTLLAMDLSTGATRWKISVGAPVRGAPAVAADEKRVIVLTADNQTLAFDMETGAARWEHRGIRESAGYFSTTAPVVSDGIVVAAYSSGEVVALRAETGNVLWSDTVTSALKTSAADDFSGIDADPIVQDGVVVVTSASGQMQASALLNGRPLWQQKIGAHATPWSAGNALFVLSQSHDVAALFKRDGAVRWSVPLATQDDLKRDTTPPLFGPILAANAVLVLSAEGELISFRPSDGKRLKTYELADGIATPPVIAGGALYVITKDAVLRRYY